MHGSLTDVSQIVASIEEELAARGERNTASMRAVRRRYSRLLRARDPQFILAVARTLLKAGSYRWIAYELIQNHKPAFECLGEPELEELGRGLDSWWTVDAFARTLAGPAWLNGQVSDELMLKWARSSDRWWRRAAIVSTVALNVRSHGGTGDAARTLRVCRVLVKDHDDMVAKAMSWALRELVVHDAGAVEQFVKNYDEALASRVKREVKIKLRTGRKTATRHA